MNGPSRGHFFPPSCTMSIRVDPGKFTPWKMNVLNPKIWRFGLDDFPFELVDF